jgi:hypothetical protein
MSWPWTLCLWGVWMIESRTEDAAHPVVLHSTTRTWASCQGVECLALGASSGMRKVRRSSIALFTILTKQTSTLLEHKLSSSRPLALTQRCSSHPARSQAIPSSQRLVSICGRDWRLLQLNRYLASMIRPSTTLVVSPPKLKRSYPGPWLAIAASATAGVSISCTGGCRQHTIFPRHLYSAIVRPDVLGGEHDSPHWKCSDSGIVPRLVACLVAQRKEPKPCISVSTPDDLHTATQEAQ